MLNLYFFFYFSTGILLGLSYNYTIGADNVPVPSAGPTGNLFCIIIASDFALWYFAKLSVGIVTLMAIERWFAITRPTSYKFVFTTRRIITYIVIVMFCLLLAFTHKLLEKKHGFHNGKAECFFESKVKPKALEIALVVTNGNVTVFVPLTFITGTIIHLQKITNCREAADDVVNTNRHLELRLLRMSKVIALCLGICFVPYQISYTLSVSLESYEYKSQLHFFTVVVSMCNPCINPWIYCLSNNFFKKQCARLLFPWKESKIQPGNELLVRRGRR